MILPLVLSFLATLTAAAMAYGTDPRWVQHPWGLGVIMLARRMQWPLIALSLILCLALLALVISGKRRAWWLIALAPVLALFVHRFMTAPANRYAVLDEPALVAATDAKHLRDDDHVVGIVFNERAYAYPYAALWNAPVIVQSDREHRMLLIWSAYANAATALEVSRGLKARDLDIVGDPADSLLIYNARTGQFLVGLTGRTSGGALPNEVEATLASSATTWARWRASHPDTQVLAVVGRGPRTPVAPRVSSSPDAQTPLVIVRHEESHLGISTRDLADAPLNLKVGDVPVVVLRDPASGEIRAFDRRLEEDLVPQFRAASEARHKERGVVMVDQDTNSGWSAKGVAIEGSKDWRGRKLLPLEVRQGVYLGPARFWYPNLTLYAPAATP